MKYQQIVNLMNHSLRVAETRRTLPTKERMTFIQEMTEAIEQLPESQKPPNPTWDPKGMDRG